MPFNPHRNRTSNGVVISPGMRVRDYDRNEGEVVTDDYARDYMCCGNEDTPTYDGPYPRPEVGTCAPPCRHDHWFTVDYGDGDGRRTKSFNGERLFALSSGARP